MSPARMSSTARRFDWLAYLLLLLFLGSGPDRAQAAGTAVPSCTTCSPLAPPQSSPDLLVSSISWATTPTAGAPIIPGHTWSGLYTVRATWTYKFEAVDSFFLDGPVDWTVASTSAAPANTSGNGLKVGKAFQNPRTGNNTSNRAHVYWGYDDRALAPANYVNAPVIQPPPRTHYDGWADETGVYLASATGAAPLPFEITYNVPASWSIYLCPGATAPYEYIGLSGNPGDPNFLQATLYSSGSDLGAADALFPILLPCRQPQVSMKMTGEPLKLTGAAGSAGTITVRYCMTTTNSSPNVYLGSYAISSETIGYTEARTVNLAPGQADTVCAPDFTYDITWPSSGSGCVTNTSGATVTAETPSGWGERAAGEPAGGFEQRTFKAAASAGVGLETCATPMAVELASLTATRRTEGVEIAWETASEHDNVGFNVYRATGGSDGTPGAESPAWKRLNATIIPARNPGSTEGYAYVWLDESAASSEEQWYLVEDVDRMGRSKRHGPVPAAVHVPNAVQMAFVSAHPLPWRPFSGIVGILVGGWLALRLNPVLRVTSRICNLRQK